jgi:hypothetical protein
MISKIEIEQREREITYKCTGISIANYSNEFRKNS